MNWSTLEIFPGLHAIPSVWKEYLGPDFTAFSALCLQPEDWQVESYPCPRNCGCWHRVVQRHDAPHPISPFEDRPVAAGVCRCTPPHCPDLELTGIDLTPLKMSWTRLGRELCRALALTSRLSEAPPPNTFQIGSWSVDAVPVFLTFQNEYHELREVIAELGVRQRKPFILFAPTSNLLTAACQEILASIGAGFFSLENIVTLTDRGTLAATKPPGELFAAFTPQPKELDENIARQTLALAKQLDAEQRFHKAPLFTVLLLRAEGLTVNQIAKQCACARSVVFTRLKLLRQKLGCDPAKLQQYSSQFESIEESLSDPRARRVYRKGSPLGYAENDSPE